MGVVEYRGWVIKYTVSYNYREIYAVVSIVRYNVFEGWVPDIKTKLTPEIINRSYDVEVIMPDFDSGHPRSNRGRTSFLFFFFFSNLLLYQPSFS